MTTPRILALILFTLASGYTLLSTSTLLVSDHKVCDRSPLIGTFAPWTSGCYFGALYKDAVTKDELDYENSKLNEFINRGGVAPDILRYRFQLHQKYQNYFRSTFQDLHGMHMDYTRANHHRIDHQIEYFSFLQAVELMPLAQTTLDEYCTTYVLDRRDDILENIGERLEHANLPLSLDYCRDNRR